MFSGQLGEGGGLFIVQSAHEHGVDLEGALKCFRGLLDSPQHPIESIPAGNLFEAFSQQGVKADVDAVQPALLQGLGLLSEQQRVGGEGDVIDALDCPQQRDKPWEVTPEKGLSSSQPQLSDAHGGKDADNSLKLFKAQDPFFRQPLHSLFRHAIEAAEVTSVRDRDPQIVNFAAELIDEKRHISDPGRGRAGRHATTSDAIY